MALVVVAKSYYILPKVLVWWPLLWYDVQRFNHTIQKYKQMDEQNTFRNLLFNGAIIQGTIHILRMHIFRLFGPPSPYKCLRYIWIGCRSFQPQTFHPNLNPRLFSHEFPILQGFSYISFMDECVIYGWMCHFWMNVPFLNECAIFWDECAHSWMNVPFMDECAIYGWMCHLCMKVPFLD